MKADYNVMREGSTRTLFFSLLLGGITLSCGTVEPVVVDHPSPDQSPLILVSIDGFRWDYIDLHSPRTIDSLATAGVRSEGLIPPFPTKTFPSHWTQVTGLHPAKHGIVANTMFDPSMDARFRLSDAEAQLNPDWWSGEPIWITARKNDLVAACMFWPGSETEHQNMLPNYYAQFDQSLTSDARVDQLLEWMALPVGERPHFATLYFDIVDTAGHRNGPKSDEVNDAVQEVDRAIERLVDGLKKQGISDPNLILVSDHGMAEIDTSRVVFLDDYIDMTDIWMVDWSPIAAIRPPADRVDAIYDSLRGKHPMMTVYRGGDDANLPDRFHFSGNDRIQPIIGVAEPGWTITTRDGYRASRHLGATHGYDNQVRDMHGLFVASGPSFRTNAVIDPIESIHLYNLMSSILGIPPAPNDGARNFIDKTLRHNK